MEKKVRSRWCMAKVVKRLRAIEPLWVSLYVGPFREESVIKFLRSMVLVSRGFRRWRRRIF